MYLYFEKVDLGILLKKLKAIGITGKAWKWISEFLGERYQHLIVVSVIPQGSVLGPLLFLVMINDINKDIDSSISLFADDTIICRSISSEECVEKLQDVLDKLYLW